MVPRMFWVFGSLSQRRCGVFMANCCGSCNFVLFRRCGVSSASCCGSGPLRHGGTGNTNWAITFLDASWRVVAGLSRADRGHHVPALAVTSGGRGVGFDVATSGTAGGSSRVLRRQLNSNFLINSNSCYISSCTVAGCATGEVEPSRTARQSRRPDSSLDGLSARTSSRAPTRQPS